MEAKVNNLIQNPSFLKDTNKRLNLEKKKHFGTTLKSYGQKDKEKDRLESKYQKVIGDKDSQKINKEGDIKNKKQTKDFEDLVENEDQKDKNINYKRNYNLFSNIFQNIVQNDDNENLPSEQDNTKIVDLESLPQINIDKTDKDFINHEKVLEKTLDLQISKIGIKETVVDKETLGKDSNIKLNVHENQSKENKADFKTLKTNEDLNVDESKEALYSGKDQFSELENLPKKETENSNENNKSKEFKLEDNSKKDVEEAISTKNKIDFTFERQEVKLTNTGNAEIKNQEPINKKQFMEHVIEKVKFDLGNSKNQIKLTLKPESLGEMIMEVEVIKNSLVAKIMVDNQRAKEIIENNLFQLKEGVKDTGLEIKTFEVFVGNNSDFNKHNSNEFNFNGRNKKVKIKDGNKDKKMELYEESIKIDQTNLLSLYSESSLNLFA